MARKNYNLQALREHTIGRERDHVLKVRASKAPIVAYVILADIKVRLVVNYSGYDPQNDEIVLSLMAQERTE